MIGNGQKHESFAALNGMCHGWLLHFVYNASYVSLFAMKLEKSQRHAKQICLPSILSNNTNKEDEANKFSKTLIISCNPFKSSSSLSIRTAFCICCVIREFFWWFEQLFLCFTKFGGGSHCLNFDIFCHSQLL